MNVLMVRSKTTAESAANGSPQIPRRGFGTAPGRPGMKEIELSAGTIEYEDTGGDGPTIVPLHGLMMDASLWDGPIAELSADHRCVAPTLPLARIVTRCTTELTCRYGG